VTVEIDGEMFEDYASGYIQKRKLDKAIALVNNVHNIVSVYASEMPAILKASQVESLKAHGIAIIHEPIIHRFNPGSINIEVCNV
jgi:hypothetical protein